jgi:hypothetical protein
MLIDKFACVRAFVTCVTVMSTAMLSGTQAQQTASAACCSTKCDSTLELFSQLLETPKECLNVCVLCESRCVLFQPSSNLLHPCIGKVKKILVKISQKFFLCHSETIMTVAPVGSQRRKTFLRGHGYLGFREVENNVPRRTRDYFVRFQVLWVYYRNHDLPLYVYLL